MSTYTLEQLRSEGPKFAMAMLLHAIEGGEPFITYGAIRKELEYQLGIQRIFPTQIGHVAGTLMDLILEIDPRAPLINVLITRDTGIPGRGVAGYLARRYKKKQLAAWDKLSNKKKLETVEVERKKVFRYKKWKELNRIIFGSYGDIDLLEQAGNEHDYFAGSPRFGGLPESEEHKRLKKWVADNPKKIGISREYGKGTNEVTLLSGDEVDVMFSFGTSFCMVEVKSKISNDADFLRGLYQCVKYREVKRAEHFPFMADVEAVLVTERVLSNQLQERARTLGVAYKVVKVN